MGSCKTMEYPADQCFVMSLHLSYHTEAPDIHSLDLMKRSLKTALLAPLLSMSAAEPSAPKAIADRWKQVHNCWTAVAQVLHQWSH